MTRTALLALAVLGLFSACAAPRTEIAPVTAPPAAHVPAEGSTAAAAAFPRTVTDRGGQPVTIPARPERIVSLAPGMTEVLFAVGAGPRVVATDLYSDYPDAARRTEKLDYTRPSAEQVVALRPDLVLMSSRQRDQVQRFRDLELPVLFLGEPESLAQAFENMRTLGLATGEDEATAALVRGLQARVDAVAARAAGIASPPRVFYELTPALHTAGPASFIGSMFTILRAQNIAPATPAYPQLTAERVIAADPEVIVLGYVGTTKVDARTVAQRPGWSAVSAVRTGRVILLDPDLANRPGPRVVDALEVLARALFP